MTIEISYIVRAVIAALVTGLFNSCKAFAKSLRGFMTETQNLDVEQEIVSPNVEDQSSEQPETQSYEGDSNVDSGQVQEDDKDKNFRALRDQLRVIESEKERLAQERDEYKNALLGSIKPKAPEPEIEVDELADIGDEDWTTRKHVQKLAQREAKAIVEQALKADRERQLKEQLPDLLKRKFSDFDEVVTRENLKYLEAHKPHIAASLASTTDTYAKAASAYEYIKAFCPSANNKADQEKAAKNAQKPGTLGNAQGASPLSQAKMFESGKLSPDLKKKLQQEMIAAARSY